MGNLCDLVLSLLGNDLILSYKAKKTYSHPLVLQSASRNVSQGNTSKDCFQSLFS